MTKATTGVGTRSKDDIEVSHAVARIHAGVLAFVCAFLGGGGLFLMTVWLVIKGGARVGPHGGPLVGPHLVLLGQYFYGYSVSWLGSIVGLFYGALVGGLTGWVVGEIYNLVVWYRLR